MEMEMYTYPSESMEMESSSSSSSSSWWWLSFVHKLRDSLGFAVSYGLPSLISALFTLSFALVGIVVGAMTGAMIGQETESGFIRGAAVGAISGAVFSIQVFESASDLLLLSQYSPLPCLLYLVDVIASLLSGRLVREQIGPAMLNAVQSQMSGVERRFDETRSIFDTEAVKGLTREILDKIPKMNITPNIIAEESHHIPTLSCSVCLQDFQIGETVRSLPQCEHMFHLPCIDKWLLRHASCPLCRRDLF